MPLLIVRFPDKNNPKRHEVANAWLEHYAEKRLETSTSGVVVHEDAVTVDVPYNLLEKFQQIATDELSDSGIMQYEFKIEKGRQYRQRR